MGIGGSKLWHDGVLRPVIVLLSCFCEARKKNQLRMEKQENKGFKRCDVKWKKWKRRKNNNNAKKSRSEKVVDEGVEVPYPMVPSKKEKDRHLARFLDISGN